MVQKGILLGANRGRRGAFVERQLSFDCGGKDVELQPAMKLSLAEARELDTHHAQRVRLARVAVVRFVAKMVLVAVVLDVVP